MSSSSRLIPLEANAQATVMDIARLKRWSAYHTRDSRGSDAGFPDLVFVRERIIHVEMKRQGERPRSTQVDWLNRLARAGGEVYVWTLDDLDDALAVLTRRWIYEPISQQLGITTSVEPPETEWWQPRTLWIPERGVVAA